MEKYERNRRMRKCSLEELDLKRILDENTWLIVADIHTSTNLPLSFLFLSMAITLCHWTNGSTLEGVNFYKIPLILFGILCGGSGTKKSGPIRLMKEASEEVEALSGVPILGSSLNNSATMESVCTELQAKPHLLQLWDELAIFLGLFGSTRSDRAAYDRGILCELYSPTGIVRRQLVSRTNVMVKSRLSILAAGHPRETINCLTGSGSKSIESNDDGLFNRFLIDVAANRTPTRDNPRPNAQIPKLSHLFFYTNLLHKEQQEYKFSTDAQTYMKECVYVYDCEAVRLSNEEDYLTSNLTKAIEQIQRLALVLHILKIVSRKLFALTDRIQVFGQLDEQFKNLIMEDSLTNEDRIIDYESCFNAKQLMDHYLRIKKILAGYDPISNKIVTDKTDDEAIPAADIEHIKNYIKNHPNERILLSSLPSNLKRKYSKEQYLTILHQLETDGHGTVGNTENTTGPRAIAFIKKQKHNPTVNVEKPNNTTSNNM